MSISNKVSQRAYPDHYLLRSAHHPPYGIIDLLARRDSKLAPSAFIEGGKIIRAAVLATGLVEDTFAYGLQKGSGSSNRTVGIF
ncbi:MAG: hypothetical protein WD939_05080 [Dehalococcoidia bacterium]